MAYAELTPLQKNSLPAKTTSLLADDGVSVEVDDQSVFYRGGSLLTKGWVLGPDNAVDSYTEEITVSATDDVTGAGTVTISARAIKADGTNGAAREWPIGTTIKNTYTTSTHDQVIDNFIEHATLITARATKTTAAMSVYVDSAATGIGDGTSWTDAFTTIQAAINSLPSVLEHAVTIYIRKGATAYAETLIINQLTGKGSVRLRGEYYWTGNCAAATTPGTTKFKTAAHSNGANIAVDDRVLITSSYGGAGAYNYYVFSTVKSVVDKGSNIYEVELNTAADWGNIGATDYYTIVKTEITGNTTITSTENISLVGLNITGYITVTNSIISALSFLFISSTATAAALTLTSKSAIATMQNCYVNSDVATRGAVSITGNSYLNANYIDASMGGAGIVSTANVFVASALSSTAYGTIMMILGGKNTCNIKQSIIKAPAASCGVRADQLSFGYLHYCTIVTGTGTGVLATYNSSVVIINCNNRATTPKNPAGASDAAYIT